MKKIIIVGGGAGGLELVTRLGNTLGRKKRAQITLVDQNTVHLWKPLLHEIATGALNDQVDHISYQAHALRHHFTFKHATLLNIDRDNKRILVSDADLIALGCEQTQVELEYDALVIAVGSTSNDFGTPGVKEHAIFLDDQNSAIALRQTLLSTFIGFNANYDCQSAADKVKIAIVGGGATGIELASELPHMIKTLNAHGYANLGTQMLDITLVEAADRILPALPEKVSAGITQSLQNIGVKVLTKTMIVKADELGLYPKEGEVINADIIVWAAGVKAPDFLNNIAGLETTRNNQLIIKTTLQTTRDDAIFVIGDCASCKQENGQLVTPTAQAAHQMVSVCAYNIEKSMQDLPLKKFKYNDKGIIISLQDTAQGVVTMVAGKKLYAKGQFAMLIHRVLYRLHLGFVLGIIGCVRFTLATRVVKRVKSTLQLDKK
ncbi:NADH dehydrogenase FAD-containing subunit [Orbus hercynius]|uniref:NADH dehydrogenase FAD-containing subunit n=1 Tax=Orbus hercynius TaxID=593135 RepID=A0A495RJ92_9GAMM|nr:NAD(P)/FAD-dependent oxidoreductase [Orbus hercynius]RKS87577.1 NADH dehydrogenase FAD-containing subunit [Orbus hercynius]